jgi:hypothetical protein
LKKPKTNTKPCKITKKVSKQIDALIAQTKGKFFSITFFKKDGTRRIINGKDKYQRLLAGSLKQSPAQAAGYVCFVNRNKETWASAHPDIFLPTA